MKLRRILAVSLLGMASGTHAVESTPPDWEYKGKNGPAAWGDIAPDFAECKLGKEQSPIDIHNAKKGALAPLAFAYHATAAEEVNNGHTIQINLADAGTLMLDGVPYKLVQFHFHTPSEEHINGKAYPLVAHLVHKNAEGKLAVVAIMLKEGKANAALKPVFDALPQAVGKKSTLAGNFNITGMLPAQQGYYKYTGSLTTPPCSEGVRWEVLKQPIEVSKAQIQAFRKLYKLNARPVQPLNGRKVQQS